MEVNSKKGMFVSQKKTILCVDDDAIARTIISKFISVIGQYECLEAKSGMECLDYVSKHNLDLIVLDYRLGDSDGLNISRIIPSKSLNKDVPIILFSVVDSDELEIYRDCTNIAKIVQKPYGLESFKQDLHEILGD